MKRILLLGMGPTTFSALESLAAQFHLVGIVRDVRPSAATDELGVRRAHARSVRVPSDVRLDAVQRAIEGSPPGCTVVSPCNRVLGAAILNHRKFTNMHSAPLRKYPWRAT